MTNHLVSFQRINFPIPHPSGMAPARLPVPSPDRPAAGQVASELPAASPTVQIEKTIHCSEVKLPEKADLLATGLFSEGL